MVFDVSEKKGGEKSQAKPEEGKVRPIGVMEVLSVIDEEKIEKIDVWQDARHKPNPKIALRPMFFGDKPGGQAKACGKMGG